jgi:hypothetical protein
MSEVDRWSSTSRARVDGREWVGAELKKMKAIFPELTKYWAQRQ